MGESGRGFGLEVNQNLKKKRQKPKKRKLLNMMVPNFLYSNSEHFFTINIIIIIPIFLLPTYFSLGGNLSSHLFLNISKQINVFNILFHRGQKRWESNVQGPTLFTYCIKGISSEMGQRKILYKK